MHDFEAWLADVSDHTLPGGVAVAALAAAMGAALAAKALRVTLNRGHLTPGQQQELEVAVQAAREAQGHLVALSEADQAAFRRVLAVGKLPAGINERREAYEGATDVPVLVAGTCRNLLDRLSPLHGSCPPDVLVDLEIGTRLLLAGLYAGIRAARANLEAWKAELNGDSVSDTLSRRIEELEWNRI